MSCVECSHCSDLEYRRLRTESGAFMARLMALVATRYQLSACALSGKQRTQHIASARQIAVYVARQTTDLSSIVIGDYFNRDHTTVLHSVEVISRRMDANPLFAREVNGLIALLRADIQAQHVERGSGAAVV